MCRKMEIITTSNHDQETGYRYGVISPHSINQDALGDVYANGIDPHYEAGKEELLNDIKELCENHNLDYERINTDSFVDEFSDNYQDGGDGQCDYSDKEYTLHVSGDNFGIFVMKSPYYTYCRGCSPCAPGAGDLDASFDPDEYEITEAYHRTLCLGHDWFDDGKAPYRVFRVEDDNEVFS